MSATYFSQIASERHIILIQSDFFFNYDRAVTKFITAELEWNTVF